MSDSPETTPETPPAAPEPDPLGLIAALLEERGFRLARGTYQHGNGDMVIRSLKIEGQEVLVRAEISINGSRSAFGWTPWENCRESSAKPTKPHPIFSTKTPE